MVSFWFLPWLSRRPPSEQLAPPSSLVDPSSGLEPAAVPAPDASALARTFESTGAQPEPSEVAPEVRVEDLDPHLLAVFQEAAAAAPPTHRLADTVEPADAAWLAGELRLLLQQARAVEAMRR